MASSQAVRQEAAAKGLYRPDAEHDACGVGFVANIKGHVSHKIIEDALLILHNLDHRGAVGADPLCGDGAGILIQIPDAFYREEMAALGVKLPAPGDYGVGMIFLPREPASRQACEQELERMVKKEGQVVLGWRDVPVDQTMEMSPTVRASEPVIRQIFIGRGPDVMVQDALERKLYVIRKSASHRIQSLKLKHGGEYFVPSMSTRTVVYKGLLLADQVGRYYRDLQNPACKSAPIRFRPGPWLIRIATSHTTAKSIPSREITTGFVLGKTSGSRPFWETTSKSSCRSSMRGNPIRPAWTTPLSCS